MNCSIGCAAWGLRETPLKEQLELSRSLGLRALEISIANYSRDPLQLDSGAADISAVRKLCADYGIDISCGVTGNDFTQKSADDSHASADKVCRVIDVAAAAGVRKLRIFAGFSSDSEVYGDRFKVMIDCLLVCAAAAEKAGVELAIETHGGVTAFDGVIFHSNTVSTRADMMEKILELMPDSVGLNFDPANLSAAGVNAPELWFKRFSKRINYLHLKDFRDTGDGILPVACGEGRLDWDKLADALAGYSGPAFIEYEPTSDVADGMRRSLDFLRSRNMA